MTDNIVAVSLSRDISIIGERKASGGGSLTVRHRHLDHLWTDLKLQCTDDVSDFASAFQILANFFKGEPLT